MAPLAVKEKVWPVDNARLYFQKAQKPPGDGFLLPAPSRFQRLLKNKDSLLC